VADSMVDPANYSAGNGGFCYGKPLIFPLLVAEYDSRSPSISLIWCHGRTLRSICFGLAIREVLFTFGADVQLCLEAKWPDSGVDRDTKGYVPPGGFERFLGLFVEQAIHEAGKTRVADPQRRTPPFSLARTERLSLAVSQSKPRRCKMVRL